ncbi:putative TBC1 domain family member 31 [Penaeus vannamei]|uniref:Putative TBC1 domain family member 31 n=1 Tax=Penaeus vannamei TaxID=6689 RepID=A0A423SGD0_PENVA|nr:putative TBC1 domain family member 31 [Penaeus vannamei]
MKRKDDGSVVVMEGHTSPAKGIHSGSRSPLVLSYNTDEVFLWSWPSLTLTNKLRLEDRVAVVWAGHVWQRDELVVCFINGSLLLWPSQDLSTQRTIEPPSGLDFDFTAFTLSSGGEWIVGGGKSHLMVTYSLVGRRVSQVVQLPSSCNSVYQAIFLPPVHPRFCQVLAILNTTGVLNIIDFTSMTKIKTVRSQRFNIDSVSVSEDGNFLAVSYANSITKVYPVNALFPEDPKNVELRNIKKRDELLDRNKWYPILVEFKSYPEKYRSLIWVSMLELPRNYLVFSTLLDKGMHSAFEGLKEVLKLSDGSLLKTLQGTLSCLAHWAPFLSSIEYLPELIFPFVKFFHSNRLLCFEVAVTFIMNWCRLWFEFWPKPSVTVLTVLSNEDWVVLWDHIFSNPPSFLPCAAAAFTIKSRHTLLTCEDAQDVKTYYSQEAWISVKHIIDKAYFIYQNTSAETLPKELFGELKPMPKGGLPIFNIGPRDAREEERGNVERKLRNLSLRTEALKHKQSKATEDTSRLAEKEEMVYTIGRKDLEKQEEECLNSILNLRKRHLATAELDAS